MGFTSIAGCPELRQITLMEISFNARAVAAELLRTWGSKPQVFRHGDEPRLNFIHIAQCEDTPTEGVTAVGTIGLSDHDLGMGPVRVELVGAFPFWFDEAPNVAATCAFNVFKDGFPALPDSVHRDVVQMYCPATTVPHALLTNPFLWDEGPRTLDGEDAKIAWLMIVPIAETELRFADANGFDALHTLFEQRQIDIFDLEREAVV